MLYIQESIIFGGKLKPSTCNLSTGLPGGKAAIVARPKGFFVAKDVHAFAAGGETTRSKEKLSSKLAKLGVAERATIEAKANPNVVYRIFVSPD